MTIFWLVRHGETDWNLEGRYQGQADPPLNAHGVSQARQIGDRLRPEGITAIFSSDLRRALHTAQIIAERLQLPVICDKRLREISLGEWEGMLVEEIIARYPQEWQRRKDDPLNAHAPRGETLIQVAERVGAAAEQIAQEYPGASVVIVSHGMALAVLYCLARNLPLAQAYMLIPDNAQIVKVEWM